MRLQAVSIALVAASGVSVLIASLGAYDALNRAQQDFYERCNFADVFVSLRRAPERLREELAAMPGVLTVETRIVREATVEAADQPEPGIGRFVSLPDEGRAALNLTHLTAGRAPAPYSADEILVNQAYTEANGLTIGDSVYMIVNGERKRLRIVGVALSPEFVYAFNGANPVPDNKRFGIFWMSRRALESAFSLEGAFNDVALRLARDASRNDVIFRVDQALEAYGALGAYDRSRVPSHMFLTDEFRQLLTMAVWIPGIFLAVSAFLLNVVVGRLVNRQRDQIATLKALGFRNREIGLHYLALAAVIGLGGIALGVPLGAWMGHGMTEMYGEYYRFPALYYSQGFGAPLAAAFFTLGGAALGAAGALSGAMRLNPAQAMRPPAPAAFQHTLVETLGLARLFRKPVPRMIVRIIALRPLRTSFSVAGIAAAVMIVVIGGFWQDAVELMLDAQFNQIQREDAVVSFYSPAPARVVQEVQAMSGVIFAEGYRTAPARLRVGPRTKDTVILGLAPGAELRRLLGRNLRPVRLSAEGLLLNRQIAAKLGLAPGDPVRVEFLEGRRAKVETHLAGAVDEFLGAGAYMDRDALNRLLDEQGLVNIVAIKTDAEEAQALYARLKTAPNVAGLSTRARTLESFRETMAGMIVTMSFILFLFAVVIAGGVVYNTAAVSLSERTWELASLRVLGFTRAEVFQILLGELGFQLALALPLGCLIGLYVAKVMVQSTQTEGFQIPVVISAGTYAWAILTTLLAAVGSAAIIRRRINHLDLIGVLKVRE